MVILGCSISNIVILGPVVKIIVDGRVLERYRRMLVFKDRDIDFNFTTSTRSDICS